jgi:hypothetical protein
LPRPLRVVLRGLAWMRVVHSVREPTAAAMAGPLAA